MINKIFVGNEWVAGEPTVHGQIYREYINESKDSGFVELRHSTVLHSLIYNIAKTKVKDNSALTPGYPNIRSPYNFFVSNGSSIELEMDIEDDEGNLQAQIDGSALGYPPLVLPIVKFAESGFSVVDEIYFESTIISGKVKASGKLPSSGNWKLKTSRVNLSLSSINANWEIKGPDITLYAKS